MRASLAGYTHGRYLTRRVAQKTECRGRNAAGLQAVYPAASEAGIAPRGLDAARLLIVLYCKLVWEINAPAIKALQ